MKPGILISTCCFLLMSTFFISPRTETTARVRTLTAIDYEAMTFHPIDYAAEDILNYEYHAFLRFDHPLVLTGIEYLNVKVGNPEDGSVAWLVKNLPLADNFEARPIHYRRDLLELSLSGRPDTVVLMPKVGAF